MPWFRKESTALKLAKIITKGHKLDPTNSPIDAFIMRKAEQLVAGQVDQREAQIDMTAAHRLRDAFVAEATGIYHFHFDVHVYEDVVQVRLVPDRYAEEPLVAFAMATNIVMMLLFLGEQGDIFELLHYLDEDADYQSKPGTIGYGFGVRLKETPVRLLIEHVPDRVASYVMNKMIAIEEEHAGQPADE